MRTGRNRFSNILMFCLISSVLFFGKNLSGQSQTTHERFLALERLAWTQIFSDPCTGTWQDRWTLDGLQASITNNSAGMDFCAGPEFGNDSCHAVLWTKESFSGDIRIEYEYTKLDDTIKAVTILYLFATGSGEDPYNKDIAAWKDLRTVPRMETYFHNMNAYHISYAAFGTKNCEPDQDYIRARRYLPLAKKRLKGTGLDPDYFETGLFKTGIPHRITVIKQGDDLFMFTRSNGKELLCHWKTGELPPLQEGRIGLRHMASRSARYRNFRVSVLQ